MIHTLILVDSCLQGLALGSAFPISACPLGRASIAEYWLRALEGCRPQRKLVVMDETSLAQLQHRQLLEGLGLELVSVESMTAHLHELELSDRLLFGDVRYWPLDPNRIRKSLAVSEGQALPVHQICQRCRPECIDEQVVLDSENRIKRIQRLFDGITDLDHSVVHWSSLNVAAALRGLGSELPSPSALRAQLSAHGIPSPREHVGHRVVDLAWASGVLQANEAQLHSEARARGVGGTDASGREVMVGRNCQIHPTARLEGPIALQDDVSVGARALLVGPLVAASGTRIGSNVTISRCVLSPGSEVADGASLNTRFICKAGSVDPSESVLEGTAPDLHSSDLLSGDLALEAPRNGSTAGVQRRLGAGVKRAFDITATLMGLIALSPLLLAVAVLIKLTSPGAVFFRHTREGRNGKPFACLKFRTMVDGAHAQQRTLYKNNALDGPQFKLSHDPRVTWVGRILRATNIDEIPQLFNVLCGDMSLVGPRPSPFRENQICVPWRVARLSVRPGITGLWQVCRDRRSSSDFHQWIYFDSLYVKHQSVALDIRILLATLLTLGGQWSLPVRWLISEPERTAVADRSGREPSWLDRLAPTRPGAQRLPPREQPSAV